MTESACFRPHLHAGISRLIERLRGHVVLIAPAIPRNPGCRLLPLLELTVLFLRSQRGEAGGRELIRALPNPR